MKKVSLTNKQQELVDLENRQKFFSFDEDQCVFRLNTEHVTIFKLHEATTFEKSSKYDGIFYSDNL